MTILGIDSSAQSASVAITAAGRLLYASCSQNGLTHSQTLLPMCIEALHRCGLTVADLHCIAVAAGPGSFTGLRIGLACAKGLCLAHAVPCVCVSSLEAMAWTVPLDGTVVCSLDARRGEAYHAVFSVCKGTLKRCSNDCAGMPSDLLPLLKHVSGPVYLIGSGAPLVYTACTDNDLMPITLRLVDCTAWGVCRAAEQPNAVLAPARAAAADYVRLSQAQRERKARLQHALLSEAFSS